MSVDTCSSSVEEVVRYLGLRGFEASAEGVGVW